MTNSEQQYAYPPQEPQFQPQQKQARRFWRSPWLWILVIAVLIIVLAGLAGGGTGSTIRPSGSNSPYVGVVFVEGSMSIYSNASNSYDHYYLLDVIDMLSRDSMNKGLLLYIDTAGGEIIAASELADAVQHYKQTTGRPVYAYGYTYAASGGYWLASTAEQIYLNRYCLTGSIGTTFGSMVDISGLLDQLGIEVANIASGGQKTTSSIYEPNNAQSIAIRQAIADEYFGYFVDWVCTNRGMSREELLPLADGRIYTATQALGNGLIDHVAEYDECLQDLRSLCGWGCEVVNFRNIAEPTWLEQMLGQAAEAASKVAQTLPRGLALFSE